MGLLNRRQALGHLAMVLFAALIGGSFSLGALAADHIAPVALNAVRFWIAAAVIGGVVAVGGGVRPAHLRAGWRYLLLGGLYAIYFVLMFEGLKTAPPVSAAAVFTLTPLMAAGFGWLLLRQRLTLRMALALAIGGIGALWVIFDADPNLLLQFRIGRGEAIYFIGCAAHALYTPMVRKLNRGEPVIVFTLGVVVAGAVILTATGLPALAAIDWGGLPRIVWVTILYTAVFTTAATVLLMQVASLRLPAAKVMAHTYMVPAWVTVWELGLGQTPPPVLVLGGVGLSVLALILLLRDEDRPAALHPAAPRR